MQFVNSKMVIKDWASYVYPILMYDGYVETVNSVIDVQAAVTEASYGVYTWCCGTVAVINSYVNSGTAANEVYHLYTDSSDALFILISIFKMHPGPTGGYKGGLDFNGSNETVIMRNNIFWAGPGTAATGGYDVFVNSDADGDFVTFGNAAACTWAECSEWNGNMNVDPKIDAYYRLQSASPAINKGGSAHPFYKGTDHYYDMLGKYRGTSPDIGPIEK